MGVATPRTTASNVPLHRDGWRATLPGLGAPSSQATSPPALGSPAERERVLNVRGAYPLLLIGSAILAYGVMVAIQVPPPTIGRFEIWQLVIVVGATVLAGGIFSLLFAIDERPEPPRAPAGEPAPEIRPRSAPTVGGGQPVLPAAANPPPWWEGPPAKSSIPHVPPASRVAGSFPTPSSVPQPSVPEEREPLAQEGPVGTPTARASDEITSTLKELDDISRDVARDLSSVPGPSRKSTPAPARVDQCWDCRRPIVDRESGLPCEECGKQLCASCGMESVIRSGSVSCRRCEVSSTKRPARRPH
jgi:hypothetical protein